MQQRAGRQVSERSERALWKTRIRAATKNTNPLILFGSIGSLGAASGSSYFSLTAKSPFIRELKTSTNSVPDIPYFVQDKFLRSIYRDPYQLAQVERMVERSYEQVSERSERAL